MKVGKWERLWQFGQEGYREAVSYILPVSAPFTTTIDIQISSYFLVLDYVSCIEAFLFFSYAQADNDR